jgi:hypothetical protein
MLCFIVVSFRCQQRGCALRPKFYASFFALGSGSASGAATGLLTRSGTMNNWRQCGQRTTLPRAEGGVTTVWRHFRFGQIMVIGTIVPVTSDWRRAESLSYRQIAARPPPTVGTDGTRHRAITDGR